MIANDTTSMDNDVMHTPRVRYQFAVSLDGFIASPDGGVDWLSPYEAAAEAIMGPFLEAIGGIVMGRASHEQMRGFGPYPFGDTPAVVLTNDGAYQTDAPVETCADGPKAAMVQLTAKMESGDVWLFGGGKTAMSFLDAGLIDLIELTTVPVVLGDGLPMFAGTIDPMTFALESSQIGPMGTVSSVYAKRG